MPRNERFDVLVVGARCAGAATAMLMARHGLKVLAVDRGEYGADTLSTHALMRGGVLQLARWGLLPRLAAGDAPPVTRTTFHYGDEALAIDIRPGAGVDALYAPRRTVLDAMLVDAARAAGAEIRHRHSLTGLARDDRGRVTGATLIDDRGETLEVAAGLVVGADGIDSTVARLVQAPTLRRARHATAVFYGYWTGVAVQDGYHWGYRPGIGTGVIPTNGGRHCVFVGLPPDRFRTLLREGAAQGYRRALDETPFLAGARPDGRLWSFAGRKGFLRRPVGPGWALVGDAGYFKDPLTAHGITDALRDAELLADAAARGTDTDLAGWAATRDRLSLPLFEVTDTIAAFDWTLDELRAHHQTLNTAMRHEVEFLAALTAPAAAMGRRAA